MLMTSHYEREVKTCVAPWRELLGHEGADGVLGAYDVTLQVRREGTCDKLLGLSPILTGTKGGDIRQTSQGYVFTFAVF